MFILSVKNGSYLLKWIALYIEPHVVIKLGAFRNIFLYKRSYEFCTVS